MSMGAVLRRRRAEPGQGFGHRHLERVDAGSARALLLVHTLNVRAQQCFHVFNPCVAIHVLLSIMGNFMKLIYFAAPAAARQTSACLMFCCRVTLPCGMLADGSMTNKRITQQSSTPLQAVSVATDLSPNTVSLQGFSSHHTSVLQALTCLCLNFLLLPF